MQPIEVDVCPVTVVYVVVVARSTQSDVPVYMPYRLWYALVQDAVFLCFVVPCGDAHASCEPGVPGV